MTGGSKATAKDLHTVRERRNHVGKALQKREDGRFHSTGTLCLMLIMSVTDNLTLFASLLGLYNALSYVVRYPTKTVS